MKEKETFMIQISGSNYPGKNENTFHKIHNWLIDKEFEAKKDGREFCIPIDSIIKKLEANNPHSKKAIWIRQRMKIETGFWRIKEKNAKKINKTLD